MADKHHLPSDLIKRKLETALKRQENLDELLSQTLDFLPGALSKVRSEDLGPQLEKLRRAKEVIDQAITENQQAQEKIEVVTGEVFEAKELAQDKRTLYDLRQVAQIIFNEPEFFKYDLNTIMAVLEIVEPQIFREALKKLNRERWQALIENELPKSENLGDVEKK